LGAHFGKGYRVPGFSQTLPIHSHMHLEKRQISAIQPLNEKMLKNGIYEMSFSHIEMLPQCATRRKPRHWAAFAGSSAIADVTAIGCGLVCILGQRRLHRVATGKTSPSTCRNSSIWKSILLFPITSNAGRRVIIGKRLFQ
jgi:hypothetical protein